MDLKELRRLKPELESFLDRYAPLFGRPEAQGHGRRFVQGLLLGGDRRSVENIAEAIDGCVVRSLQTFITNAPWGADAVLTELRRQVAEEWGDPEAVVIVDETGFPKKGTKSVGVKRQYSGTLGRVENCQVGVFLGYHAAKGHTLLDRRLFVPEEWAEDRPRRQKAGVPEEVIFRTKPELALAMVADAAAAGLPFRWVAGDSVYGDSPTFCQGVRALGKWYVLDSSADARVWTSQPEVVPPGPQAGAGAGDDQAEGRDQAGAGGRGGRRVTGLGVASSDGGRGQPGAVDLRVRRGAGVVQRGGVAERSRAAAGASVAGPGAGPEVPPDQRPGRGGAGDGGRDPVEAVEHRAGLPERQGRVRAGRVRDAGLGRVAPPHGAVGAGPVVPGPAAGPVRGEKPLA